MLEDQLLMILYGVVFLVIIVGGLIAWGIVELAAWIMSRIREHRAS